MKQLLTAVLALLVTVGLLSPARAGDYVPFQADFRGFTTSVAPTADPDVVQIVVDLHGQATQLGAFDEVLTHYLNVSTLAFAGFAVFTAANGDTFHTVFFGQGYPTVDPAWITFDVTHTIVGGTGRFAGATGGFVGVNGRYNLQTGEDIGGYEGTISSPGANRN